MINAQYTQVSKFQVSGKNWHGAKWVKTFRDSGTPINFGAINCQKTSQIVYGKVSPLGSADFFGKVIEFGSASVVLGKGKSKVTHVFPVFKTDLTQWAPLGFSL